jgi:hypothetical protein
VGNPLFLPHPLTLVDMPKRRVATAAISTPFTYKAYKAVHRRGRAPHCMYWSHHDPDTMFEVGETYHVPGKGPAELCKRGFHACSTILRCFSKQYGYTYPTDAVLEVELSGNFDADEHKACATVMKVLRVVPKQEVAAGVAGDRSLHSDDGQWTWWYRDGVLHRDTPLPAVVGPRLRAFYNHGVPVRKEVCGSEGAVVVTTVFSASGKPLHVLDGATNVSRWLDEEGMLHSPDVDTPAYVCPEYSEWYTHGVVDRGEDKPAVVYVSGDMYWVRGGSFHRDEDKPAVVHADGTREWYYHGVLHPRIILADGSQETFVYGEKAPRFGLAEAEDAEDGSEADMVGVHNTETETEVEDCGHPPVRRSLRVRVPTHFT